MGKVNEYDLALEVETIILKTTERKDLTDLQVLNYLRSIESAVTVLHEATKRRFYQPKPQQKGQAS